MIIIRIINKATGQEVFNWEKPQRADDYYNDCFGKPERWVRDGQEDISQAINEREVIVRDEYIDEETGEVVPPEMRTEYLLESEFNRVEDDLGNGPALQRLRGERNEKLRQCDWTQMSDSPLSAPKKAEWASYRQALRDLPEECEDPSNPIWPTQPE